MLFTVTIRSGGQPYWVVTVEAEDWEGAHREAMRCLDAGTGRFLRKAAFGNLVVEIEPVSRDQARATNMELHV